MDKNATYPSYAIAERVVSVDFLRGFTMFILIIENTHIISQIRSVKESRILQFIASQFSHQRWEGIHFWDLIQPAFMFIVGVAIVEFWRQVMGLERVLQRHPNLVVVAAHCS